MHIRAGICIYIFMFMYMSAQVAEAINADGVHVGVNLDGWTSMGR